MDTQQHHQPVIWLTATENGYQVQGPKSFPNRKRLKDAGAVFHKETKAWLFPLELKEQAEAVVSEIVQFYNISGAALKRSQPSEPEPAQVFMTKEDILARFRILLRSCPSVPSTLALKWKSENDASPSDADVYVDIDAYVQAPPIGGYCLTGRDLLLLRDCIPLQRISNGHDQKPRYYRGQGYHYVANDTNLHRLRQLVHVVGMIRSEMRQQAVVVEQSQAPLNKDHGIIAWDIPFVSPTWMGLFVDEAMCKRDDRLNPILNADGTYHFQKSSFTIGSADAALRHVRRKDPDRKVFSFLHDSVTITNTLQLLAFTQHSNPMCIVALAVWSGHARYLVRDVTRKRVDVYDPWKQTQGSQAKFFKEAKEVLEPLGWSWNFVVHRKDQGTGEGSCVVAALARVLMVAHHGACDEALKSVIEPAFAVLASRLMSAFRSARIHSAQVKTHHAHGALT